MLKNLLTLGLRIKNILILNQTINKDFNHRLKSSKLAQQKLV